MLENNSIVQSAGYFFAVQKISVQIARSLDSKSLRELLADQKPN